MASGDCSNLDGFQVFKDYLNLIRNRTSFDEALLKQCQEPICQTLWGFGLEDLSGIGAAIGYNLSIFIGTFLCFVLRSRLLGSSCQTIFTAGLASFFESAVYFALAIQIATCRVFLPKDLETARSSAGVYELRSAGLVSTLCILPLLSSAITLYSEDASPRSELGRHFYRLLLLVIIIFISLYPFVSQSMWYFAPSIVGDGKGSGGTTYITDNEWRTLWRMCFESGSREVAALSSIEFHALGAFHMLASVVVVLYGIGAFVVLVLRLFESITARTPGRVRRKLGVLVRFVGRVIQKRWAEQLFVWLPCWLTAPLFWGFWRLRSIEKQLAETTVGHYTGNDWGFGQVMAVTIFVPVVVEMLFIWVSVHCERRGERASGRLAMELGNRNST